MNKSFLISIIIYLILKVKHSFHMLQQNRYNEGNHYIRWINKNAKKIFLSYDLILIPIYLLGLILDNYVMLYFYCIPYLVIDYIYHKSLSKGQNKQPLVFTKRIKRLSATVLILYLMLLSSFYLKFDANKINMYYLYMSIAIYLNYIVVYLANIINTPIEKSVNYYYYSKAHNRIKSMTNMEVI